MKTGIAASIATVIKAPIEKVWEALTEPAKISQYLFGTQVHTNWKVGCPIEFTGEWQGKPYKDKGTIFEFTPNETLRYDYWSSMGGRTDSADNYMMVTFKLNRDDNDHTLLTLTQENIESEESKAHSVGNWQMVLGHLKHMVEQH